MSDKITLGFFRGVPFDEVIERVYKGDAELKEHLMNMIFHMHSHIYRKEAEPIAEEIIQTMGNYLRYKLSCWPKAADFADMKRLIKSIITQHLTKGID